MVSNEFMLLMKLTKPLYNEAKIADVSLEGIDIDYFVKLASRNNLLFYASKEILGASYIPEKVAKRFEKIVAKGNRDITIIGRSLEEVKSLIPDALAFKTFRGKKFTRIPNDIDILTNNFEDDIKKFIALGYDPSCYLLKEGSIGLIREGRWKIHLHRDIVWARDHFFDSLVIKQSPRTEIFNDCEIRVPNVTADVLIHLAHMNFESLHIGLGELLYLFNIIPGMDFHLALEQVKKYRWKKCFLRTLNLVNNFHEYFYGRVLAQEIRFNKLPLDKLVFPYCFPRTHLILSALEKRLFIYPLRRLFKTANILFSGQTFDKYISPADRETKETASWLV